jgi:hypothetical protein
MVQLKSIFVDNGNGCLITPFFTTLNRPYIVNSCVNCNQQSCTPYYNVEETKEGFQFNKEADGKMAFLEYSEYDLDQAGLPFVDRDYKEPLKYYLRLQEMERLQGMGSAKFSLNTIDYTRKLYEGACRRARAASAMRSVNDQTYQQIGVIFQDAYSFTLSPAQTRNNNLNEARHKYWNQLMYNTFG